MRRLEQPRASYAPKSAIIVRPKGINAEVYVYDAAGKVYAVAFSGKRDRPDFHSRFSSPKHREQVITEYLDRLRASAAYKNKLRADRKAFRHDFKPGDVLHYSWGYDQTQCEFYQVTETRGQLVTVREIAQATVPDSELSHGMADYRTPVRDSFIGEPLVKRAQGTAGSEGYLSFPHGCASRWNGQPKYCSWYA